MSKLLSASIVLTLIMGSLPAPRCSCEKAGAQDVAHGANETIEYSERTVKSIKGHVVYNDGSPVDEAVVEVYQVTPANKKLSAREIVLRHERRAACVTANDGSFCFDDLPSGSYAVRAGTRSARAGMNDVYIKVNVNRRWWSSWLRSGKEISLALSPGT